MVQFIRPATKIKVVPRDGELEIILNINITVDGNIMTTVEGAKVVEPGQTGGADDKTDLLVPDFSSGFKIDFGRR